MNICILFCSIQNEEQFTLEESLLEKKLTIYEQDQIEDKLIHVCLYFLQGPRIKKLDITIMKRLSQYVNIIPVLAKGDCYTQEEVKILKEELKRGADEAKIDFFDCQKVSITETDQKCCSARREFRSRSSSSMGPP